MRKVIGLGLVLFSGVSFAQSVPVEDLDTRSSSGQTIRSVPVPAQVAQPSASNKVLMDLHYEVQSLREEVRSLRGIVEEQANDLRQLRQRQLDDYQDLDRRLSSQPQTPPATASQPRKPAALSTADSTLNREPTPSIVSGATSASAGGTQGASGFGSLTPVDPINSAGESESYTATYNLMKVKKFDEAIADFKVHVAKFPNGTYTANAYYWLGEIYYLIKRNLIEAEKAYSKVVEVFPEHSKAPDAMYKLGRTYHDQGKNDLATTMLRRAESTNSAAAALARSYLRDNNL